MMKALFLTLLLLIPSTVFAQSATNKRDNITSSGDYVDVDTKGMSSFGAEVSGTFVATLTFQCTLSDRVNASWIDVLAATPGGSPVSSTTTTGTWLNGSIAGCLRVRVVATAYTSGTAVVELRAVPAGGGGSSEVTSNGQNIATEATVASMDATLDSIYAAMNPDAVHDNAAIATGPQVMGECDDTSTDAVDEGDAGKVRVDCTTRAMLVRFEGCTPSGFISAASVNETALKASAGRLVGLWASSLDATPVYIKLYNDTTANIDETDTPVWRLGIPANSTASLGTASVNLIPSGGLVFSTAITLRVTTGIADNDTGALTANEVLVSYCTI